MIYILSNILYWGTYTYLYWGYRFPICIPTHTEHRITDDTIISTNFPYLNGHKIRTMLPLTLAIIRKTTISFCIAHIMSPQVKKNPLTWLLVEMYTPKLSQNFEATTQANTESSSYGEWRNSLKMKRDLENNLPTHQLNQLLTSWVLNSREFHFHFFPPMRVWRCKYFIILDFIDNIHSSQRVREKKDNGFSKWVCLDFKLDCYLN